MSRIPLIEARSWLWRECLAKMQQACVAVPECHWRSREIIAHAELSLYSVGQAANQRRDIKKAAQMFRLALLCLTSVIALAACEVAPPTPQIPLGADGRPLPVVVRINPADAPRVRERMTEGLNAMRAQNGLGPLRPNAALASAAATHAQDMSFQSRPWHWGSDLSSPMQRAQRAGYQGSFVGELISETFETEVETVNAWMVEPETRAVILDRRANEVGVAWHQDDNGKLWWTVVLGEGSMAMAGAF